MDLNTKQLNEILKEEKDKINSKVLWSTGQTNRTTILRDYYLGKHDIYNRVRKEHQANEKVAVNWIKMVVDRYTTAASGRVDYIEDNSSEDGIEVDLEPFRVELNKQTIDDLEQDLIFNAILYGRAFEYITTEYDEITDDLNVVSKLIRHDRAAIVRDNTIDNDKLFGLIWSGTLIDEEGDEFEEVRVLTDDFVYTYSVKDEEWTLEEKLRHLFGGIPLIEWTGDRMRQGEAEQIIPLNDTYNKIISDASNETIDSVGAILAFFSGSVNQPETQQTSGRAINAALVEESSNEENAYKVQTAMAQALAGSSLAMLDEGMDMKYISKPSGIVDDAKTNLEILTENIHMAANIPYMDSNNFGNPSGTALEAKYKKFVDAVESKIRYFNRARDERFELYSSFLHHKKGEPLYRANHMKIDNEIYQPVNAIDEANELSIYSQFLPDRIILEQIPYVDDVEEALMMLEEEDRMRTGREEVFRRAMEAQLRKRDDNEEEDEGEDL